MPPKSNKGTKKLTAGEKTAEDAGSMGIVECLVCCQYIAIVERKEDALFCEGQCN